MAAIFATIRGYIPVNRRTMTAGFAFLALLVVGTTLGCGTTEGTRFIDLGGGGGGNSVARFAYVTNGDPECGGDCNPLDISAYTVNPTTGALTAVPGSPFSTDAFNGDVFYVETDPAGKFLFMGTRGNDGIQVFSIDQTTGALTEVSGSPFDSGGSDAFQTEVDSQGKFLYATNQQSGTVTTFSIAANGALTLVGSPVETVGSPTFLGIAPNGKFLYVAVASEGDVLQGYSVNSTTGALTEVPNSPFNIGSCPGAVATDRSSTFVIVTNSCSHTISVFKIDPTTGSLSEVSGSPFAGGDFPVAFAEATVGGQTFIGVNNVDSADVSVFSFNSTTGALTPVSGSPFGGSFNSTNWIAAGGAIAYVTDANNGNVRIFTLNANGSPTEATGSPVTTGGLTIPEQILLVF